MIALALAGALALAAAPQADAPAPSAAPVRVGGAEQQTAARASAEGPDVELHVPKASVEKVSLDVENLQTRLDIDTKVASAVQIHAGVAATVQKLKLELEGVEAETHLLVRLNRVAEIMEHALGTIDRNPGMAAPPAAQASIAAPPSTVPTSAQVAAPLPPDASALSGALQQTPHKE